MASNRAPSGETAPARDIGAVRAMLASAQAATPTAQASLIAARRRGREWAAATLLGGEANPPARLHRLQGSFHPANGPAER